MARRGTAGRVRRGQRGEGAELSLGAGDERNEHVYEAVERVDGARDLCMGSHFAYGTRAGWPRIRALLRRYGVAATLNANGRALHLSPWIAQEAVADGHEVSSHGWRWERHVHMAEAEERRVIERAVSAIADAAGTAPVGWHTRSATSVNTRRLLVEHGGFLYDSNAYDDDLPYIVDLPYYDHGGGPPLLVPPYALDTNDMKFFHPNGFVRAREMTEYVEDALSVLEAEAVRGRLSLLSIGYHLRICGRPRASRPSGTSCTCWQDGGIESGWRDATPSPRPSASPTCLERRPVRLVLLNPNTSAAITAAMLAVARAVARRR